MRIVLAIAAVVLTAGASQAQYYGTYGSGSNSSGHSVRGHYNSSGSYTEPHYRSNPNNTQYDNYSTRGNVNPYTGSYGTRTPRY